MRLGVAKPMRDVFVAGVATTPFGRHLDRSLAALATEASEAAIRDGGLQCSDVEMVVFANAAEGVLSGQEMIRGQVALKETSLAGLPLFNTENACASGGSAAHLAWLAVAAGHVDRAIAIGVEKLFHTDKSRSFAAIESGTDLSLAADGPRPEQGSVMMGTYAAEARGYAAEFGDVEAALAAIAVKNRKFASFNPHAQYRSEITTADVYASREVVSPLRLLTCSPLTDGAAAILLSADAVDRRGRPSVAVTSCLSASSGPGGPVVERVAEATYRSTGLSVDDIDVFQLHDASAFAELQQYEQIGIAAKGAGISAALEGRTGLGGDMPVNTDGGLLSRGHALGATGLAQLSELVLQLRGEAGARQVAGARRALSVNAGGWMGQDYAAALATVLSAV